MLIAEIRSNLSDQDNNICEGMRGRSNTFPTANADIMSVRNSGINLSRSNQLKELYKTILSNATKEINVDIKLVPLVTTNTATINAKDYVYLGSCESSFIMDMGVTLDNEGRLLFINGQRRGLILGIFNKYIKNRKYNCYNAHETTHNSEYLFDALYINENGKLIGRLKGTSKQYAIEIEKNSKTYSSSESSRNISLRLTEQDILIEEEMKLEREDGVTLKFSFKDNKLYLSEYKNGSNAVDYREHDCFIKTNLLGKYNILSVKKTRNELQIEIKHNKKTRIVYLNPEKLLLPKLSAKKFSHKPPQSIYSALGADPYEHYESGQPFSSTRLGNFSSKWIPLFGDAIDNFRINFQKSKLHMREEKYKKSIYAMANAVDPGVRAMLSTIKNFSSTMCGSSENTGKISDYITNMDNNYNSLIDKLPATAINKKNRSLTLSNIVDNLGNGDQLSLIKSNDISAFCGISRGGYPFFPGYFVGFVGAISKKHQISFNKIDDHNISCSFDKNLTALGALLAGTGQGLEKTLLKTSNIDYFTILPFESNLIYVSQIDKSQNLTLQINKDDLSDFTNKIGKKIELINFLKQRENDIFIKNKNEYTNRLSIEARALEFRLQIGTGYQPENYVVAPRSTAGFMLSSDIFSIKQTKEVNIPPNDNEKTSKKIELNVFSPRANIVRENKIMPIVSTQISNNSYYAPLPIVEESKSKNIISRQAFLKKSFQYGNGKKIFEKTEKTLTDIIESLNKTDMEIEKSHDIRCLTNLEMICTKNKNIKSHLLKKIKGSKHPIKNVSIHKEFIDSLKKTKKELLNNERKNMGKSLRHHIRTDYILSEESKRKKEELEYEIATIKDNTSQLSSDDLQKTIEKLYSKVKSFKENATYLLSKIDLMSTGTLSEHSSTIPNLIFYFNNEKSISLTKNLASIKFNYNKENPEQPYTIDYDSKISHW